MKVYKLTNKDGVTRVGERNQTQWGEDVTHRAVGGGVKFCTDDVIHGYRTPRQAVFFNPIHGDYDLASALLWECKTSEIVADDGTKVGCKEITTLRQVSLPVITTEQRVEIGIRCALTVYDNPAFVKWANAWLDGTDRSGKAAGAAGAAAEAAWSAGAARAADWAAGAAAEAAWSAARAANAAARAAGVSPDVLAIIEQVCAKVEVPK